jgi:glutaredoxin
MSKKKHPTTTIIVVAAVLLVAALFYFAKRQANSEINADTKNMVLFYSLSCPHCQNVEDYIASNGVKEKYDFAQLEISQNQKNSDALVKKARACGLDTQGLGVPFLWTGEKCLMGDTDIIEFFKK